MPKLTTAQNLHILAFIGYGADAVLAYSNKVTALPVLPTWLTYAWPFVLIAALIIHVVATFLGLPPADAALDAQAEVVAGQIEQSGKLPSAPTITA